LTMPEDPKIKLAQFETTGSDNPEEKTRVESKQMIQLDMAYRQTHAALGDKFKFYRDIADKYDKIMMSHKGRRSDDIREMFISQRDSRDIDVGHQPLRDHMREKRRDDGNR